MRCRLEICAYVSSVLLSVLLGSQAASDVAPRFGDFTRATAAAKGMFDMIDRESELDALAEIGIEPAQTAGVLEFRDVTFAYPSRPESTILQGLNLKIESGKTTALIGSSGSGKSTVVGLIERWFDPNSGSVFLDGQKLTDLNVRWLRNQVGLVQQEPILFNDSIYNNVAYGLEGTAKRNLPESEKRELVRQACIQAFADEFIQLLPQKYDTVVGQRGNLLSGGQKQRVVIARTIIADPKILLLDEATAALDPTATHKVQKALDNLSQSRTTLVIAHNLSTIQKADKIIVFSQGKVVEEGTHQQLLEMEGEYHRLVNAQSLEASKSPTTQPKKEDEIKGSSELEPFSEKEHIYTDSTTQLSQITLPVKTGENAEEEAVAVKETSQDTDEASKEAEDTEEPNIARKLSLMRCVGVILKQQRHLWFLFLAGIIGSCGGGAAFPAQAVLFGYSISTLQEQGDELIRRGKYWALVYFLFSLGVFASYLAIGFFWTVAAFRTTRFYRREYLGSMLRQDIAYFDVKGHSASQMTSRLSMHPQRVLGLLSTNLALQILVIVDLSACCIISLAYNWRLGLVTIAAGVPLIFSAGYIRTRMEMNNQDRVNQTYLESTRFASEAIASIRTISSLTLEKKILENYQQRIDESSKHERDYKLLSMVVYALTESVSLAICALGFWYGSKLLSQGKCDITSFFIVFISITQGVNSAGFMFGFTSGKQYGLCQREINN